MARSILFLMLAILSAGATAAWTRIGGTDRFDSYADRATIVKNGNLVKMWELRDYKVPNNAGGKPHLSSKLLFEFDCKDMRRRLISFDDYSGNMGNGKVVITSADLGKSLGNLEPFDPGTHAEVIWKFGCGK